MNKNRCQLCDGPIVNGRCAWCGMPFKNDEILYHLNESRSEHYLHATPQVRKAMDASQVPLADRGAAGAGTAARNPYAPGSTAAAAGKSKKPGGTAAHYAPGSSAAAANRYAKAGNRKRDFAAGGRTANTYKNKKPLSATAAVLTAIIALCVILPSAIDYVKVNYGTQITSFFHGDHEAELNYSFVISKADGEVTVGDTIRAGGYRAVIDGGYGALQVQSGGETERYSLREDGDEVIVKLQRGDVISLRNMDEAERWAQLFMVYDDE